MTSAAAVPDPLAPFLKRLAPGTPVTADSREVRAGGVFVAVRGEKADGHRFIAEVDRLRPAFIVGEEEAPPTFAPYVRVADARAALAQLAARAAGDPSLRMKMVGITGTSGKTTLTYLVESVLRAAGERVGVIGTVNFRFGDKVYPSTHTTPGAAELQRLLAAMRADGVTAVVMEVSSHALAQSRVGGIAWDAVAFLNLSRDHLDFHADMEDYFRAKRKLFEWAESERLGKRPFGVVSEEDEWGRRLLREMPGVVGYRAGEAFDSPLVGDFNARNLACAAALARGLGVPEAAIAEGLRRARVPGRLEPVPNARGVRVFVDYAHKPGALEKVLITLRALRDGHRLITVFGCGGDRDRGKRPIMGKLAAALSDHVIVTSDNPRTEDPAAIIAEILAGLPTSSHVETEPDRRAAIGRALARARGGDVVLIAGKGHEDYQVVGDEKRPFDDRLVAAEFLGVDKK